MSQRGSQARDNGQAAEFHKILDHPGVVENSCHWRAWRIQFGEAQAMPQPRASPTRIFSSSGRTPVSRSSSKRKPSPRTRDESLAAASYRWTKVDFTLQSSTLGRPESTNY